MGIPVGHHQLFKFSLASEVVLPDNRIVPATPLPTLGIGRVMGTVFVHWALPTSVDRAYERESVKSPQLYRFMTGLDPFWITWNYFGLPFKLLY